MSDDDIDAIREAIEATRRLPWQDELDQLEQERQERREREAREKREREEREKHEREYREKRTLALLEKLTSALESNPVPTALTTTSKPACTRLAPATRPTQEKSAPRSSNRPPSGDRQRDILATLRAAKTPLQRGELVNAMRLSTEGKIGFHLAWMVDARILVNVPQRGYWPAADPVPE